jgi:hypothetical protein
VAGPDEATEQARSNLRQPDTSSITNDGRPATVPDDFVPTPGGYLHPSCIIAVGKGEQVREDGQVGLAQGAVRSVAPCPYAAYSRDGQLLAHPGARAELQTVDGWVAELYNLTSGPATFLQTQWTVPPAPLNQGSQIVYFFPGLQPTTANPSFILQPVLGWAAGKWTIASWSYGAGNAFHSDPIDVNPGETILGTVQGGQCNEFGVCSNWNVITNRQNNGVTVLTTSTRAGQVLDMIFPAVLEAYNINTCSQYPPSNKIDFTNITVEGRSGQEVHPGWIPEFHDVQPRCSTGINTSSTKVGITWFVGLRCFADLDCPSKVCRSGICD